MEIADLLTENDITIDLAANRERLALARIVGRLISGTGVDEKTLLEKLLMRERLGSTALGHGVAIPHAVLDEISRPAASLTRLSQGIDFDSPDYEPVDLFLTILWPQENVTGFLPALAQASRLLRSVTLRDRLREARSPAEALTFLGMESQRLTASDRPPPLPPAKRALQRPC